GRRKSLAKLIAAERATLASLTGTQQQAVQANSIGAGGTTTATYAGPTSTQAGKAVAFAYAQLGKPYQWGAAGPGSYDCSGLVQVVAVGHPLARVVRVEVAGDLLPGPDDHGVLARPGRADGEGVAVDVHRVVHGGGVGEDHPDPLALLQQEPQRTRPGHVEG